MRRYCSACSKRITTKAKFCPHCGVLLTNGRDIFRKLDNAFLAVGRAIGKFFYFLSWICFLAGLVLGVTGLRKQNVLWIGASCLLLILSAGAWLLGVEFLTDKDD